ncbi:MAG: DNA starvation/stationary phase protection protein Dps [Gemmataceae bacterium]
MHRTKNDLPQEVRASLIRLLNHRLSDVIDLHLQAKQAHWNVRGPNFIALHELFDKVAETAEDHSDEIAERIGQLGGIAEGTVQVIHGRSKLPPYSLTLVAGLDHVEALATALATFGKQVREAIDEAARLNDADTADLFTEVSRENDKNLWFVEAHLQADR